MHCRISFFGDWHVQCKRLVRNEWKTWAAITPHSGFPSVRSPRILLSNVSASCTPWFGPAPSASEWSGGWDGSNLAKSFRSRPTVVLDQVLSPDGKSWIPPEANSGRSLDAVPNHYVAFRGDLRHGVVANGAGQKKASRSGDTQKSPELRLTLLVNYWDRRPAPPNCQDYDGTVYRSIQDEGISPTAGSPRLSAA